MTEDKRLYAPAVARNVDVIADRLQHYQLMMSGRVLEVGCGSGEHAMAFLSQFPNVSWTAIEPGEAYRESAIAWADHMGLTDRFKVLDRDLLNSDWADAISPVDTVFCANVFHISPIAVMQNFFAALPDILAENAHIALYGPYRRNGVLSPQSNIDFDVSLKSRNPDWGIRDLEQDVLPAAERAGLHLIAIDQMPANNLFILLEH